MLEQSVHRYSSKTKLDNILSAEKRETYSKEDKKEHNAVISLLKGEYDVAIEQLLEIEKLHPNQYSIASNLGTAYELNGDNEKALAWIKKGIKRDVNSHYGTEWLHQHILKLKIKLAENPNFLQTSRAIPIEGKFNLQSKITFDNSIYTVEEIKKALHYQLRERTIFVKPKEIIVADLFYALALIEAETSTVEEAIKYLSLAELYGFSNPTLLAEKKAHYTHIKENPSIFYIPKSKIEDFIPNVIFFSLFFIILILLYRFVKWLWRFKGSNK
jgi:tetratricopeptide (TPR) repeat protein